MIRYYRKIKQRTEVIPKLIAVEDLGTKIVLSKNYDYVIVLYPKLDHPWDNEFYFYGDYGVPECGASEGEKMWMLPKEHLESLYEEISQAEFTASFL